MTRFNHCPNCQKTPGRGFLGKSTMDIFECRQCRTVFCYRYCGDRCPSCASPKRIKIGYCSSR